jgi:hypothetical protein
MKKITQNIKKNAKKNEDERNVIITENIKTATNKQKRGKKANKIQPSRRTRNCWAPLCVCVCLGPELVASCDVVTCRASLVTSLFCSQEHATGCRKIQKLWATLRKPQVNSYCGTILTMYADSEGGTGTSSKAVYYKG